jgi:Ser/Thr protein kinase RdoA (MazF antagonist)
MGKIAVEVLKRRVVRYRVEIEAPGISAHWGVIGKVYESKSAGESGSSALIWLNEQGFNAVEPTAITVPSAFAYVPELQLLLMEEVPGSSLKELLKSARARPEHLQLFAAALVKLHRFPAGFGEPFTLDDHLVKRCAGLVGPLARAFPAQAPALERVVTEARRAEAEGLFAGRSLSHGDFHPAQVHLDGERLWLVDLDPLHCGDPAYDVAMALVSLKRMEAGRKRSKNARALRAAFLDGYFSRMDLALAARLPLNAALIYLKRACKRFRWQDEPGWRADVRRQIRFAEECLKWNTEARAPRGLSELAELCERCPG